METIKGSREIRGLQWNVQKLNYFSRLTVVLTALCCQIQGYSSHVNLRIEESTDDRGESLPLLNKITIDVHNNTAANYLQSKLKFSDHEDYLHGHSSDPWSSADTLLSEAIGKSTSKGRSKRSVVHLFNMVVCATGCNPLIYKGYGCYCGFLGSGYPVDGIDRCCWMHDRCYDASGCPTFSEYFIPYYWKCYRGYQPICAVTHGSWGGSGSCAQRLCECDRALAMCLKRFRCPSSKAVCTSSPFRLVQNIFMIF